ncbi:MAG: hypothetical protein ACRDTA_16275 [Pseudonocardiaceae bacterium]
MTTRQRELIRPRMRQDVAFLETLDGVYVRGPDNAFVIRGASAYQYLCALLPNLTGTVTVTEMVAGLPAAHAAAVRSLLTTLAARGVVVDGPDPRAALDERTRHRYASQLALLAHHGDDGTGFGRAATARVVVASGDLVAASALAEGLRANGVGSDEHGSVHIDSVENLCSRGVHHLDLLCLLAIDKPEPRLFTLADAVREAGGAFLSLVRVGGLLVLGPWQDSHFPESIYSVMLRMSDNRIDGSGGAWQAAVAGTSAAEPQPVLPGTAVSVATSVAGFEVFKALTGRIVSDVKRSVVIFDPERLTIRTERVVGHPAAPHGEAAAPDLPEPDQASISQTERDYRRFEPVVADVVGLVRWFEDDAMPQIPVKVAVLLAPSADPAPLVAFGAESVLEARLVALERAAAHYALNIHRRCPLLQAAHPDAEVVTQEQLETWLASDGREPCLVAGWEFRGKAALAIDRAAVLAGPWDRNAARFEPARHGLAAASAPAHAASKALLDAAAAYSIAAIARGDTTVRAVAVPVTGGTAPPGPERSPRLSMLIHELAAEGVAVQFMAADGVAPLALVRTRGGGDDVILARGGRSWLQAAEAAMLDIVGSRQLASTSVSAATINLNDGADLAAALVTGSVVEAAELDDIVDDETILARLLAEGRRAALIDLTPPDLVGVTAVARVLLFRAAVHDATADQP